MMMPLMLMGRLLWLIHSRHFGVSVIVMYSVRPDGASSSSSSTGTWMDFAGDLASRPNARPSQMVQGIHEQWYSLSTTLFGF